MNAILDRWHRRDAAGAQLEILSCNGSTQWAALLTQRRPFMDTGALLAAADAVWADLDPSAWEEAFNSHPRLGGQTAHKATTTSLRWSAAEQSGIAGDEPVQQALAAANRQYEERFGHIFLVCAAGKSSAALLTLLHQRLSNDPATEWREAAEQQRRITQLRLRSWLELPPPGCEDV